MSRRRPAAAFVLAILLTMNPPPESAVGAWSASADAVSALHVDGNQLVDSSGLTVQVRGVNRSGTEYACIQGWGIFSGPNDAASIQAMKAWRVNAVRVPLNEDCWLGINGVPTAYSGPAYQQAIKDYVSLLNQNGLYAILDLHWSAPGTSAANWYAPMPDLDHSPDLWSGVAAAFKGNDAVIFELFNEPWPDSQQDSTAAWTCWRDGGSCPGVSVAAAGMQTLVNAVRAAGATNVLVLDGVSYGNSLSQWLTYKPNDSLNNLAAAWHVYNFNVCNTTSCFDATAGVVDAQVPVLATEIGTNCDFAFMTTIMNWLDARQAGYVAWTWNAWGSDCSSIALISDYAGTPTDYGQTYKLHLADRP